MVSKEGSHCALCNSESDSESAPSLGLEHHSSGDSGRGDAVRKRNKALQVRFKDICEAQSEAAARVARTGGGSGGGRSASCRAAHRRYMTMPARRSIPNVTRSTAVQTSPDLKTRYQTFPFERKKGHTIKHTVQVESHRGQNNGFLSDVRGGKEEAVEGAGLGASSPCKGKVGQQTRALLHTPNCSAAEDLRAGDDCADGRSCLDSLSHMARGGDARSDQSDARTGTEHQGCRPRTKHRGLPSEGAAGAGSGQLNCAKTSSTSSSSARPLQDRGGSLKVTSPIAWNSLTQVESLESPSAHCKRKKGSGQLNGLQTQTLQRQSQAQTQSQSQTLPRTAGCSAQMHVQAQCHSAHSVGEQAPCQQVVARPEGEGGAKAQLQAMETLISSSQETIKVLLGVIQELEKGEAHREGLSYRTGQDTANCDTCRNSACIIYSVELDFKQQEDKLLPLMRRLCPTEDPHFPSLPYPHEVFTSTPKRKSKTEAKKHARWKLWFL